jgi:acyl-CoA synthetase (AMP-forming)/AMP-acid ligase II
MPPPLFQRSPSARPEPATLVEVLEQRAADHPDRTALTFLPDGSGPETTLTYAELRRRALAVAGRLSASGACGQRVVLFCPAGLDYLCGFFGCQYAGATAVPLFPPSHCHKFERLQAVLADADVRLAITTRGVLEQGQVTGNLPLVFADAAEPAGGPEQPPYRPEPSDLAFLQYTSGSTATPLGVMVSHQNLLSNLRYFREWGALTPLTCAVSWLPLFHDMGLVSALYALYVGTHLVLLPPLPVVQRPLLWLEAITRFGATFSGGPNVMYELCCRKITAEQRRRLDLRTWQVAFTGAEPIRAATLDRFADLFGECGFVREAFLPCYGLAEFTLGVTGSPVGRGPVVGRVSRSALGAGDFHQVGRGTPEADCVSLVSCGSTAGGHEIHIVDPESRTVLPEGKVGEVWARGPSMAGGYWNRPKETAERFGAYLADGEEPFLRTGDLGVLDGGELYIVGRIQDVISLGGSKYYPQDIEFTVERCHRSVALGGVIVVAADEGLVVLVEAATAAGLVPDEVFAAVREALSAHHRLAMAALVLLKPGRLPRTTSGKMRRPDAREQYRLGKLQGVIATWKAATGHPLVGTRVSSAPDTFESALSLARLPWLADHRVKRAVVMPAAGYLEMALAALGEAGPGYAVVGEVAFQEVLLLHEQRSRTIRLVLGPQDGGRRSFEITSGAASGAGRWNVHARGWIGNDWQAPDPAPVQLEEIRDRCSAEEDVSEHYADLARSGLHYGPRFRAIVQLWRGSEEALGRIEAPTELGDLDSYRLHPAILDAAFHVLGAALRNHPAVGGSLFLPARVASLRLRGRPTRRLWAHAAVSGVEHQDTGDLLRGDVTLFNEGGDRVAQVRGLTLRRLGRPRHAQAAAPRGTTSHVGSQPQHSTHGG